MGQFLGTHQGKLDAKNRLSVPASYRNQLKLGAANAPLPANACTPLIVRPSHNHSCLEVWTEVDLNAMAAPLEKLNPFSAEYDDLSLTLFGDAETMEADKEGRIVLPAKFITYAQMDQKRPIAFTGRGKVFEIWDAELLERRKQEATRRTRERSLALSEPRS